MNWLILALSAAVFSGLMDFFIKLSSGKIHATFSGFLIDFVAALVLIPFILWSKDKGENVFSFRPEGLAWSVLAGIAIGLATVAMLRMFETGTNLSIGSPLVRVGSVVLVVGLGVLFLKEAITAKFVLGFLLSGLGLYLLTGK